MGSTVLKLLRKILPKTLFARGILIVILPIILMQAVTIYIFFERHLENVNRHAHRAFVSEISFLTYLATNQKSRRDTLTYLFKEQTDIQATFLPGKILDISSQPSAFVAVEQALKERIDLPLRVVRQEKEVEVTVELADGVLTFRTSAKRIENQTVDIFILWVSGSAICSPSSRSYSYATRFAP